MPLIHVTEVRDEPVHRRSPFSQPWPRMHDRSKIVASMLMTVRQIAASEAFARDAMRYANMAEDLEDAGAANALRAQVVARRVDIVILRGVMAKLVSTLGKMPIEVE